MPNPTNPQSLNRYSYVRNSPLNLTDPTGHRECDGSNDCSKPFHEAPSRSSLLPDEKPTGLNQDYGELAWEGLQKIQAMEGGWWGDALSAQEAIMLILNHELGEEMGPNAHHAPLDALINKFNNNCSGGRGLRRV
ncbi:MAG: hypothetical protein M5U34_35375 [Chloroflexi bacterium]|nr:hypothetical protein [Chloroflexota bacterium]